jgi:Flp pilus assembly protein TadD
MLAVLEYRHGNCAAAVPHFEKAGELIDSQLDALHAYATCLMRIKRPEAAAATLQKSVALNPSDPRERQVLASVLLLVHKPQDALSALQPLPHSNKSFSVLRAVAMGCS